MNLVLTEKRPGNLADVITRLGINGEYFWNVERLVPFEHWVGHIPFAFWIVKSLRPTRLVELGVHRGNSYCAMCQAVSTLGLVTQGLAVDTWEGDTHMGREEGILEELQSYHDARYATFSTLMKMTFNEARAHVDDGSVDLLHIDGCHTYEAVRRDFEDWKATLSSRGVVMFHDTMVRRDGYGVWRLWKELASEYPSFEFRHSYGLGVLGVGTEQAPPLRELFAIGNDEFETHQVRSLFAARGEAYVAQLRVNETARRLSEHVDQYRGMSQQLSATEAREAELARRLEVERAAAEAREAERARWLEIERQGAEIREAEHKRRLEVEQTAAEARVTELARMLEIERAATHMLRGTISAERDAAYKSMVAAQEAEAVAAAAVADRVRLQIIETSTIWRASRQLTRVLNRVPPRVRYLGRGAIKVGWWTVTGRLSERLRQRRAMLSVTATRSAAIAPAETIEPMVAMQQLSAPAKIELPNLQSCRTAVAQAKLAVVLHVHFPDVLPEIEQALSEIPEPFDVYASVTADAGEAVAAAIRTRYANSHVYVFPNHGRDVLPFLAFAETGALSNYAMVLKVHTKRSLQTDDGDAWRQKLVQGILGSADRIRRILDAFEADPDLGVVVADGNIYGDDPGHWRDTREAVLRLGSRIGIRSIPADALFPGGSIYWIRPFLLRTLGGMNVSPADFEAEPISIDGSAAHAVERLVGLVCADAGMTLRTASAVLQTTQATPVNKQSKLNLIAYYLPQFHPVPENSTWWGEGFTEWTNVTRATPSFPGHRQPRLPADLGFYDLRVPEVRERQAELALKHGIGAFCYYYYWFDGRGMLRQPLNDMLASGRPDFPFLICWANEPWTRNWDGGNREVLLPQTYVEGWPEAFARDIAPVLRDPRYFRLEGLPVLLIYRIMHIPERQQAFRRLRDELLRLGVGDVHLGGGWVGFIQDVEVPSDPRESGLDAYFEFPPHRVSATEIVDIEGLDPAFTGHVYDYGSAIETSLALPPANEIRHRGVMLGWDNTARNMLAGHLFHGATPANFRRWLRGLLRLERLHDSGRDRLIFINGWNEWAEGAYLEPDRDFGRGWLEAVASAVSEPILTKENLLEGGTPLPSSPASMTDEEWLQRVIAKAEGVAELGAEALPPFPAPAWQAQFVGSSNAHAMREAFAFYKLVKEKAALQGLSIQTSTRVLDFGCGWGRFIRLWMKDIGPTSLHGIDVDPDMIGFCRISGLPARFDTVPSLGPTAFKAESLDIIFAYSVFSHLPESAYEIWMTEFGRILRPGGVAVFTTQARRFLEGTVALRGKLDLSDWECSLQTAFPDIEQTIAAYDRGDFVFAGTGGGDHRPPDVYGEAAIPAPYLQRTIDRFGLRLLEFIDDPTICPQAVAIVAKPTAGKPVGKY